MPIFLTPFLEGRGRPMSGPLDGDGRRSIYLAVRRNFLSPFLQAFDTPSPFQFSRPHDKHSNVPAQAVILLNDPFVHQQADLWAKAALIETGNERGAGQGDVPSAPFGHPLTVQELETVQDFINRGERRQGLDRRGPHAVQR